MSSFKVIATLVFVAAVAPIGEQWLVAEDKQRGANATGMVDGAPASASSATSSQSTANQPATDAARRQSVELSPYRIQIRVSISDSLGWSDRRAQTFVSQLQTRLDAVVGGLWKCKCDRAPPALSCNSVDDLDDLSTAAFQQSCGKDEKSIVLWIGGSSHALEIAAKEYDALTQTVGGRQSQHGLRRDSLPLAAAELTWRAFRPLARIESIDDSKAVLRLHAGRLVWPVGATASRSGTLYQPAVRRTKSAQSAVDSSPDSDAPSADRPFDDVAQVKIVDWHWLSAARQEGPLVHCDVHSGLVSPLALNHDGRNQYLAIASNPVAQSTTVKIVDTQTERPLPGLAISIIETTDTGPRWLGQTSADGVRSIDGRVGQLSYLSVQQGPLQLARVPIVVGQSSMSVLKLTTADGRAMAISELQRLRADLIEAVARREVLLVRARSAIVAKNLDEGERLLKQIRALPDGQQFSAALNSLRQQIVGDNMNALEQEPLVAQFEDAQKQVAVYLNNALVEQLASALARLRGSTDAAVIKPLNLPAPAATIPAVEDPFGPKPAVQTPVSPPTEVPSPMTDDSARPG